MRERKESNLRVLIADDEWLVRQEVKEALQGLGYKVVGEAADGHQALNLARQHKPDVAVLDIKMPEVDGVGVAERLMQDGLCAVVLLTAYATPDFVRHAAEVGVYGYLTKPFDERELDAALQLAMARFAELQNLRSEVARLEEQLATRKLVEKAKGILMKKHQLSEDQAYRLLQRRSMETRKPMRAIAEAIIIASSVEPEADE